MTKEKKNLTWKLKELPSAGELAELVEAGVITSDEAREILFGNAENDKEKIKALEDLVEFLQNLVKDLSKNRTTYYPIHRTIYYNDSNPYWNKYWGKTHEVLCSSGLDVSTGSLTTSGTTNNKNVLLSNGTGSTTLGSSKLSSDFLNNSASTFGTNSFSNTVATVSLDSNKTIS